MKNILNNLSLIVPIAPQEEAWAGLWEDLKDLPNGTEIIFSGPKKPSSPIPSRVKWIDSAPGRAQQLNEGARSATRDFLWFLHADSRFTKSTLTTLIQALNNNPNAFYYFDLRFLKDGPPLMRINEIGCWIRSRLMGLPFGDQGFCLSKMNFELIGGFPENIPYGEDHLFVWRAQQHGVPLKSTGAILKTSARKYQEQGWLPTTALYYKLWTEQARLERETRERIRSGQTTAVAVFVKTPGITPLKTRLADTIGKESALAFYELCLEAIQKTLSSFRQSTPALVYPYWAVAERQGISDRRWNDFNQIWQGDGDLGEKLHHVYSTLFSVHKNVILIGADAPQLSQDLILKAHHVLQSKNKFVIGPARDGGFYLFGGAEALPKQVWTAVTYSQPSTCDELVAKIKNYGEVVLLPTLSDADVYEDLPLLVQELQNTNHPTQRNLLNWIEATLQKEVQWA